MTASATITGVTCYETNQDYYWVTSAGKTTILTDRKAAIALGLELAPTDCTLRFQ